MLRLPFAETHSERAHRIHHSSFPCSSPLTIKNLFVMLARSAALCYNEKWSEISERRNWRMFSKRISRLLVLVTVFCYGALSLISPCLHTHFASEENERTPVFSAPLHASASAESAKRPALRAAEKSVHCFACEWQQANLSPALSPLVFVFPYLPQTDVHVAAPRAPSVSITRASSRAPPLA